MRREQGIAVIAGILLFLDTFFKFVALRRLPEGGVIDSVVAFRLYKNFGIAFDIPLPLPIAVIVTLVILAIAISVLAQRPKDPLVSGSLLFLIAGGLGNLLDRVLHGFTVDYVILFGRSAINGADLMILGAVGGLLVAWVRDMNKQN